MQALGADRLASEGGMGIIVPTVQKRKQRFGEAQFAQDHTASKGLGSLT